MEYSQIIGYAFVFIIVFFILSGFVYRAGRKSGYNDCFEYWGTKANDLTVVNNTLLHNIDMLVRKRGYERVAPAFYKEGGKLYTLERAVDRIIGDASPQLKGTHEEVGYVITGESDKFYDDPRIVLLDVRPFWFFGSAVKND